MLAFYTLMLFLQQSNKKWSFCYTILSHYPKVIHLLTIIYYTLFRQTIIHEDSLELVSNDTSRSVDVGSTGRVIEETFEMPWYMKYLKFYTAPVTKFVANIVSIFSWREIFFFFEWGLLVYWRWVVWQFSEMIDHSIWPSKNSGLFISFVYS